MSTATEPLTGDEEMTLRHVIEAAIRQNREVAECNPYTWNYWVRRIEELRSAAAKLGLKLNEANT